MTLNICGDKYISGSRDGFVNLWDSSFVCILSVNLRRIGGILDLEARSMAWCAETETVVVGTTSNEIYQIPLKIEYNSLIKIVLSGSYGKELCGMSISSDGHQMVTTADDKMLRIWDLHEKMLVRSTLLHTASKCCSYSPDNSVVAVGFGASAKILASETPGKWAIFCVSDLSRIFEARPSRKMITEIKWSDNYIAIGSHDCKVYLYSVSFSSGPEIAVLSLYVIDQHYSPIVHIDFSLDSKFLKVNCMHNLHFYSVDDGKHIENISSTKDISWKTHNCCYSWDMQGIWHGLDIGCVDSFLSNGLRMTVSGHSDGHLGLHTYPCIEQHSPSQFHFAHCKRIRRVKWINEKQFISIGQDDKAIMMWKIFPNHYETMGVINETDDTIEPSDDDIKPSFAVARRARPWVKHLVAPNDSSNPTREMIEDTLNISVAMKKISGLDGHLLHSLESTNEIFIASGSICVVNNTVHKYQKLFRGHDNSISSISLSSSHFIATGEKGKSPNIRIWDFNTCSEIICLQNLHGQIVRHLKFTKDNKLLISIVREERNNKIVIWKSLSGEWFDGTMLKQVQIGFVNTYFLETLSFENYFAVGTDTGVYFWNHTINNSPTPVKTEILKDDDRQPMLSCTTFENGIVTGAKSGHIYLWLDSSISTKILAHDNAITSLQVDYKIKGILSGCDNGLIISWSNEFKKLRQFDLKEMLGLDVTNHMFSRITFSNIIPKSNTLFVSMKGYGIYQISTRASKITCLSEAHKSAHISDIVFHPLDQNIFATCENDGMIRIWDHKNNSVVRKVRLDAKLVCITWSNDGNDLLVGGCSFKSRDNESRNITVSLLVCFLTSMNIYLYTIANTN